MRSVPGQVGAFHEPPRIDAVKWLRPGLMSSVSVEAYTPAVIVDAVLATLIKVDLDPCAEAERTFPAAAHYTKDDNGLGHTWVGKVYMNPPYGRDIDQWTTKLRDEFDRGWVVEAIALLPARVETEWWHKLNPPHLCVIAGRLTFGRHKNPAPFPSVAAYFGPHSERFRSAFGRLGLMYEAR
jgi:hypothetical protein